MYSQTVIKVLFSLLFIPFQACCGDDQSNNQIVKCIPFFKENQIYFYTIIAPLTPLILRCPSPLKRFPPIQKVIPIGAARLLTLKKLPSHHYF